MARTVAIGVQDFETLIERNCFYVDKTHFIKEWWDSEDAVTLITRPRRFGKTLTISMTERFFSVKYAGQGKLFEGLKIWESRKYRDLQGVYPVISLSFANIKEADYESVKQKINEMLTELYEKNSFLKSSGLLGEKEVEYFNRVSKDMDDVTASLTLHRLSDYLSRYYGKKVILLLDEYDTPMQEAYVHGYWDRLVIYTRNLFNAAFKTNPYLERAIMTGITRVSKESIFSDLNNLKVVTTTSGEYADVFGFTEPEVFSALEEYGYTQKDEVRRWYDGFTFGGIRDIYNPWSILNFLDTGKFAAYWANTSSNNLVGKLIRGGSVEIKQTFECLLNGKSICSEIDEQIAYNQLDGNENAIWSLLLASGYLKVLSVDNVLLISGWGEAQYELALTNYEVSRMFASMVRGWFSGCVKGSYNGFIKALLSDDRKLMNIYMNKVALDTISYFDSGKRPSGSEPERFYHGFVLGLLVEMNDTYTVTSNRESGYGRYDIMLEPRRKEDKAIIIEFKVYDADDEETLEDTAASALKQIEDRQYAQMLIHKGVPEENIRKYGFAFQGKKVLIR